ncbi:MAG: DUF998 domain-containing protein [Ignavibacteriaceae bacterium]|jgi:hypothetical membrane protein
MIYFDRFLCLSGIAAPIFLLFAVLLSGFLHPGYSHISQAISELGAKGVSYKDILNYAGLIPAGLLTITFSVAMFRHFIGKPALFISCCLVALMGAGRFFAGIFPCDPGCLPIVSISGHLHMVFGIVSLFAGSIAPIIFVFGIKRSDSTTLFYWSLILGLSALIMFSLLISQLAMAYFGGIQRVLLILTYSWIILISGRINTVNY